MNFLRGLSRYIVGIVFILSGLLKALDPVGGGLKIKEYLSSFYMGWLDFISMPLAFILPIFELLIGVALIKRIKMEFFSKAALIFISFFTLLTLITASFNLVEDCGCFGEAIKLSHWSTFFKNLVLLGLVIFIFIERKKIGYNFSVKREWIDLGINFILIFLIIFISLYNKPIVDFGSYKHGADLLSLLKTEKKLEYSTTFIYSKDGVEEQFTLENLPDSSWVFVDAKTTLVGGDDAEESVDFEFKNSDGEYIAKETLLNHKNIFILSIYKEKFSNRLVNRVKSLVDSLARGGESLYLLSALSMEKTDVLLQREELYECKNIVPVYGDYKFVISLNRSNGGVTYINNGVVIIKWSNKTLPIRLDDLIKSDKEIMLARLDIWEQIFFEVILALFLLQLFKFSIRF